LKASDILTPFDKGIAIKFDKLVFVNDGMVKENGGIFGISLSVLYRPISVRLILSMATKAAKIPSIIGTQ
jgi:hypothetical protein